MTERAAVKIAFIYPIKAVPFIKLRDGLFYENIHFYFTDPPGTKKSHYPQKKS